MMQVMWMKLGKYIMKKLDIGESSWPWNNNSLLKKKELIKEQKEIISISQPEETSTVGTWKLYETIAR